MSKTIIIGFEDAAGLGKSIVVASPAISDAEQGDIMDAADRLHKFPANIKRLIRYELNESQIVEFISDEVAAYKQQTESQRQKGIAADRARDKAQASRQDAIKIANLAFSKAAQKRNSAIAAVAAKNDQLVGASEGDKQKLIESRDKLQPLATQATAEFDVIRSAGEIVRNPKSTDEQVAAALADIKDPAAALKAQQTTQPN